MVLSFKNKSSSRGIPVKIHYDRRPTEGYLNLHIPNPNSILLFLSIVVVHLHKFDFKRHVQILQFHQQY